MNGHLTRSRPYHKNDNAHMEEKTTSSFAHS